jgi:TldD protein
LFEVSLILRGILQRPGTKNYPTMSYTRRNFLMTSGLALSGLGVAVRTLSAARAGAHSADAYLGNPVQHRQLETLALQALDAARQAGASYADIRVGVVQTLSVLLSPSSVPMARMGSTISYGIRVIANGAMAFDYGTVPTTEAVVAVARNAVTQARGFSKTSLGDTELAPAPVVTGEWATPYGIDPCAVPILEQGDLLSALKAPSHRTEGAVGGLGFSWERETRICATTEGSRTTQLFQRAIQNLGVTASWVGNAYLAMPEFRSRHAGYEVMTDPRLPERIRAFTEHVKSYSLLPVKRLDIGRYPVVLDGASTAMVLSQTIGPAVQMDRVLGDEADASGTSFLAPPENIINTQLFSSKLSVTSGRPLTALSGAMWDDECVAPEVFPVITGGNVVEYVTDRRTSSPRTLGNLQYEHRGRSRGYAVTSRAHRPVVVGSGHLAMTPSPDGTTLEDVCRDVKHGLLLLQALYVSTDQQMASGLIGDNDCLMLEIKNGRVVSLVKGVGVQFKTKGFWKALAIVGDRSTVGEVTTRVGKGHPWQPLYADASAPATCITSLDVIALGR